MGKRSQVAQGARGEMIRKHVEWATKQEPIVGALISYTKGCHVYAPAPTTGPDTSVFNYHPVARFVLIPPVCEAEVVIPAGYAKLTAGSDKSRRVILFMTLEADEKGIADGWYVQVGEGLEIVRPGGSIATLRRNELGVWMVVDPPDEPVVEEAP